MKQNFFLAFYNKQFLYLWLAEVFTQIPVNILNFLLILVIFKLTNSNTAVSIIVLSFTLPAVFLGILAGVYTDRWNKKKVLYISNFLRAIFLLILTFFSNSIFVIYLVSFLFGIVTQFFIPAETPIIPIIVSSEELLSANALFGIGIFGSILIAYLLSGPMLLYLGFIPTLILLILSLLIAGILISKIQVPFSEENKTFSLGKQLPILAMKEEILDILRIIRKTEHILSSLLLLALSQILILTIAAIAPGYAHDVLHIKVEQFPLLVITPATLGIIVGAFFIANKLHNAQKRNVVTVGIFVSSIALILMPYGNKIESKNLVIMLNSYLPLFLRISHIDIIIFLAFLLGVANALVFIPSNTLLQEKTNDTIRGKIYGVLNTFVGIFSFTPVLLVGSFADLIGVGSVVIGIGLCLLLLGMIRVLF